jgi:hypothetical protein
MKNTLIFTGILLLAALSGCTASYNHEEVTNTSTGNIEPTPVVTTSKIQIPVGSITVAQVIPYNSDHNPMVGIVQSDNPSVLTVEGATGNKWAFSGVSVGSANISFLADGAVVATVAANVVVQGNSN